MPEVYIDELKQFSGAENFRPLKIVWLDLKLVKQWSNLKAYQVPEQLNLSLILGEKPKETDDSRSGLFIILPTTENEEWSLEKYQKLFDILDRAESLPKITRLTIAVVSGDSTIVYYHLYPGIHAPIDLNDK